MMENPDSDAVPLSAPEGEPEEYQSDAEFLQPPMGVLTKDEEESEAVQASNNREDGLPGPDFSPAGWSQNLGHIVPQHMTDGEEGLPGPGFSPADWLQNSSYIVPRQIKDGEKDVDESKPIIASNDDENARPWPGFSHAGESQDNSYLVPQHITDGEEFGDGISSESEWSNDEEERWERTLLPLKEYSVIAKYGDSAANDLSENRQQQAVEKRNDPDIGRTSLQPRDDGGIEGAPLLPPGYRSIGLLEGYQTKKTFRELLSDQKATKT
ncbi:hypothetical protein B0H63DRAFT_511159 [Podospora didyma]|uniref:Uncharacterized protein n=1 Tax=Podospora didyma TaxID=330526 RepID=A0AAE0TVR0_9PEZI|nr:hypothetical protein B0H63DRAFT_511159 [Podospora didyma]